MWGSTELSLSIPSDIHQQMYTIKYKSYISVKILLHVSVPRCHPQRFTDTEDQEHQHISQSERATKTGALVLILHYFCKSLRMAPRRRNM